MKNVILNGAILDLDGATLSQPTGKIITVDDRSQSELAKVTFAGLAKRTVIASRVQTDAESEILFALAVKLNDTSKVAEPETLQLTDDELLWVKKAIDREPIIIRHRFAEMVADQNPA